MSVSGSPSAWADLLEDMLPQLLELVVNTWNLLQRPLRNNREDTVTDALCRELRKNRNLREMPFLVIPQMVELGPAPGQGVGRLDIAFFPAGIPGSPDENVYFCLECKRLNVKSNGKRRREGSKYVKDGLMRFVIGQYGKAVRHGGMVGYVLDGDIAAAIANVEANIRSHCAALCMTLPGKLYQSSVLPNLPTARESFHQRQGEATLFRVHHLFFAADNLFE